MSTGPVNANRYTHGHEPSTLASHGVRTAENSAAYLLPHLKPGMSLLDVGCGPGSITLDLAQRIAPGNVVGVDPAAAAVTAARLLAAERGDVTTRFEAADVMNLPYDDGAFDVVHAHQVLQHLTDPVGALREMARVTRPGGWLAVREADYGAMSWSPELPGLDLWRRTYTAVARRNGADPNAARCLRAWLRAAGLTGALSTSTWTYADAPTCAWWGESQADRYSGQVFRDQAAEVGVDIEGMGEIEAAWRAWGCSPDAWFVLVHGELLVRR